MNDAPLTITSLEDAGAFQYKNQAPQLAGTGFEGHAGTGWFAADAANVKPGATVAVVGDGAVGLLGVLSAKLMGAERTLQ